MTVFCTGRNAVPVGVRVRVGVSVGRRVDGNGEPQPILKSGSKDVFVRPTSWAPDGSGLLIDKTLRGKRDILFA